MALDGTSSYGLLNSINQKLDAMDFDALKISIASPEKIRSWSYGEVTKQETVNYRTSKPERDGLFCARIFGPIKDYECLCGKYKKIKYKGIICEKCGVEVTQSRVRRERMGHIELATPVSHIWFLKSLPSRISIMLDIMPKYVEKVLYFESYIVTDSKMTPLENGQLLTEEEYQTYKNEYGEDSFDAGMGGEAIRKLLEQLDLPVIRDQLRKELKETKSEIKKSKIIKRLKMVEAFIESNNRPEWMILTVLPVIPPDLRPLVQMDGGGFAASDLNELYRKVISRNNRLKRLMEMNAPDIIIKNEKRILQEAVDSLLDNTRSSNIVKSPSRRPYKSLSDMLKGKQGRFRQNLLGKRVDYSGRSVIVVGPNLKLHQCGLPKRMALELFKPFVFAKLEACGLSNSAQNSKRLVESEKPEVWDMLAEVIKEHPVLLNRAPTLHRLGIQAFEPLLIEGNAIQLHPLACVAFNADFDGDQMSVHVPLSIEAQVEARVLMMSTNNILNPQSGKPIITPRMDMILGVYYITLEKDPNQQPDIALSSKEELEYAYFTKRVGLHDRIIYRFEVVNDKGEKEYKKVITTVGRFKLYDILPEKIKNKYGFDLVNKLIGKKEVGKLVNLIFKETNQYETAKFCDDFMELGFKEGTLAGISVGKDDLMVPETKSKIIEEGMESIKKVDKQYQEGLITSGERYNKVIDIWSACSSNLKKDMVKLFGQDRNPETMNSFFLMADSGSRGSETQMQQMCAMRGLVAKPNGEIIETPITSNLKEGLSVLEYFISSHGGRKGTVDTALKTANAGYLTRRLVDSAQDCIITEEDCGTTEGIHMEAKIENGRVVVSLSDKILGRVVIGDVINPETNEVIIKDGEMVTEAVCDKIEKAGIKKVFVRSILTCKGKDGFCAKCYGRDLTTTKLVSVGEAVGVVAAQAIGEPGTQLTMRTKHTSGATSGDGSQSSISATEDGYIRVLNLESITNKKGETLCISKNCSIEVYSNSNKLVGKYKISNGAKIYKKDGEKVNKGDFLAEWDPYNIPIFALQDGIIEYKDLIENVSVKERIDEQTGVSTKIIIDWKKSNTKELLKPSLIVIGNDGKKDELETHDVYINTILNVINNQEVECGDIIARIPHDSSRSGDITGGLPRVAELFEARKPKNTALMSCVDGVVKIDRDYKAKDKLTIIPDDASETPVEYMIPKGKYLLVDDGYRVKKGDLLMDGKPTPHDILRILGIESFAKYMVEEVQKVYEMQGITINDKHIEIILHQMLKKVEVINPGETTLIVGETLDKDELEEINAKAIADGLEPAKAESVLLGITRSSLQSKSFISAASFQETTKILTDASIQGKIDRLHGLKENIIVGKLIPAGTGLIVKRLKEEAKLEQEQSSDITENE